ncbi:MAG: putative transposase in snaA-snaB intergenic region [Cyanobacteria bacterium RYN_339]|nr:putative transposase in snaA-snaB intergenic region [Cyanobacteria bacterium RYN_339]
MIVAKTFRFRLEPNAGQRQLFARFAGCCRFVFNQGLAARKASYETEGKTLSYADQCKALPDMKKAEATAWLRKVHSQVLQQALKDLDAAYQHFFRRVKGGEVPGFPRFKKKGQKDAFRYPQGVKAEAGRVYLPKIGWVAYRDSRPVEGVILQATIKREGEHWFVSLACEVELQDPAPLPVTEERAVGIDVGLKSFAVLSDGTAIENPRYLKSALAKLKQAQRRLARKTKRSNNWKKQVAKVVKLHIQVKNARKDFAHKASTVIVKNHDVIAVEDLNIKGMVKNRRLSRAISDVGWGLFLDMLAYKAAWAGKHFVKIGRFEATSKTCSTCGEKKAMPLSVRTYACGGCGTVMDRDWNASLNIRAAGLAVLNACGGV